MASQAEIQAEITRRQGAPQAASIADVQAEIARRQQQADPVEQTQQAIQAGGLQPFFKGLPIETVGKIRQQTQQQGVSGLSEKQRASIERIRLDNPAMAELVEQTGALETIAIGGGRGLTSAINSVKQLAFGLARGGAENNIRFLTEELQRTDDPARQQQLQQELANAQEASASLSESEQEVTEKEITEQEELSELREIRPTALATGEILGQALPAVVGGVVAAPARAALPIAGAIESQLIPATAPTEEGREQERLAAAGLGAVTAGVAGPALSAGRRAITGEVAPEAQAIIQKGRETGTAVLTTDVAPPESIVGKLAQSLGEKVPLTGTGGVRALQQRQRQEIVNDIADEFGLNVESPLAADIVASLQQRSAQKLTRAKALRNDAIQRLDEFGPVNLSNTTGEINTQLERLDRLGPIADESIINRLTAFKESLSKANFSLSAEVRSELLDDLRQAGIDNRAAVKFLSPIKDALNRDLMGFARGSDPVAARRWVSGNAEFAEELTKIKTTELKRILDKGEATPESVLTILRGNKPSELNRLSKSITADGRASARAAIIRGALEGSGFFRGDVNPNRFATELGKPRNRSAINVFFKGEQRGQIEGTRRFLEATRRAQDSSVSTPTGLQALAPGAAFAAKATGVISSLFSAGTTGLIARVYESAPVRTALLKLANTKPNSKAERQAINALLPILITATDKITEGTPNGR